MSFCSGMITGIGITGGEVPEVEVNAILIVASTGIILEVEAGLEAEAVVQVQVIAENGVEEDMTMRDADEVGLMKGTL